MADRGRNRPAAPPANVLDEVSIRLRDEAVGVVALLRLPEHAVRRRAGVLAGDQAHAR